MMRDMERHYGLDEELHNAIARFLTTWWTTSSRIMAMIQDPTTSR